MLAEVIPQFEVQPSAPTHFPTSIHSADAEMPLFFAEGSPTTEISDARLRQIVRENLTQLETKRGAKYKNAAIVPPDFTRFHSYRSSVVADGDA